ncbi:MAG: NGG1p interacting factor NIF3 [Candidatus Levybacteria bacterium RIFCSPLOWO2_01_FULL_38_21]|nr:MAG: NGG1p interacting factor NIF3 [Candidatus Levybacteria bacterium RIFCSPLOWO2_01_FULL_38_21]
MTLQEIYDLAVEMGIKADPREKNGVKRFLARTKKEYEEMPQKKKQYFDKESFKNPYSDSRILFGDPKIKVGKLMAGIDAGVAEVLLLDRLNQKEHPSTGSGQGGIDLLVSHHPSSHALASLHEVMDMQIDMFEEAGVPANVAHALFEERKSMVKRRIDPRNHTQVVDTAKLLDIPLLAIHTVWDNLTHQFMTKYLGNKKFETAGDIMDEINKIPEFIEATKGKAGPSLVAGSEKNRTGKIFVSLTGGTNPSKELYIELAKAGVGTIIEMHVPEDVVQELRKLHINFINTGHMASDSIGANIFLDEIEKRGVKVIPCSGLIRVRRIA